MQNAGFQEKIHDLSASQTEYLKLATAGHGPLKICSPKQEKCINGSAPSRENAIDIKQKKRRAEARRKMVIVVR